MTPLLTLLLAVTPAKEPLHLRALYNSLDPNSIRAALAFYELYPDTHEGKRALARAQDLLQGELSFERLSALSKGGLDAILALVNRDPSRPLQKLVGQDLSLIAHFGKTLPNRLLKGYSVTSEKEVLALPPQEIDVARALLLAQFGTLTQEAKLYEAVLDLMALQVLAKAPLNSSAQEKIEALNHFVFNQMRFRFPPHSIYAKEIDHYTFLPSVLDNHLGVCLGVTMLYLSLAQRIDLPLEVVTPPGHIFVRYLGQKREINIETTARGVDVPTEKYLSVNTHALQTRDIKESIGLTFVNQASVFLHQERYQEAVAAYEKALAYLPKDPLVNELLGYAYLFTEQEEKGKKHLTFAANTPSYGEVAKEARSEDYLNGLVGVEGLKAIFLEVDDDRASVLQKQEKLLQTVKKYPQFRAGWFQLGITYLQLHRSKEALSAFEKYEKLDANNPVVQYYLALLYGHRHHFVAAWKHLKKAESLTQQKAFLPLPLKTLREELLLHCPEV